MTRSSFLLLPTKTVVVIVALFGPRTGRWCDFYRFGIIAKSEYVSAYCYEWRIESAQDVSLLRPGFGPEAEYVFTHCQEWQIESA